MSICRCFDGDALTQISGALGTVEPRISRSRRVTIKAPEQLPSGSAG